MKLWDVVIIGGGLSGLVAANLLAQSNLSVLVLEKGKEIGGRSKTDRIQHQLFNIGPHALYKRGKAASILEQLGIELNGKSPKLGGILIDNELNYTAPFSPIGVFTTRYFNWKERLQWLKTLVNILTIRTDSLTSGTFLQWVQQTTTSNAVQSVLLLLGRLATYCHAPEQASAKIIVSQLKSVMNGVLYLDGGWQTMIDQLYNKAVMSGVEIRTHLLVKKITPMIYDKDTAFNITLSNEETIFTRKVLSTISPQELLKILGEQTPKVMKDFLTQIIPVQGATLDVALTKLPEPTKLFALDLNKPLYYSVHSTYAHLSNDSNNAILHVFKYLQPNEEVNPTKVRLDLEQFLETLQPGWRKHVITKRFIPHITVNERLPLPDDEKLLESSKSAIPGLYLAGDWASPDHILSEGAVTSTHLAVTQIIQMETS